MSWHPALRGRRLAVSWPVNEVHVLLIGGHDLNGLSLTDTDLILFERRVVLSDQHGGSDVVVVLQTGGKERMADRTRERKGRRKRGAGWRRHNVDN